MTTDKHAPMSQKIVLVAHCALLLFVVFWISFAVLSGIDEEKGWLGIIDNLPNALPWLFLAVIAWATIRFKCIGGVLLICAGLWSVWFFHAFSNPVVFVIISGPLILLGMVFVIGGCLRAREPASEGAP